MEDRLESRRGGVDEVQVQWRGGRAGWRIGKVEWMKSRCSGEDGRETGGK